jgi:hypothetical protein
MCQATGAALDHNEHLQHPKRGGDSHEEVTRKKATSQAAIDNGSC